MQASDTSFKRHRFPPQIVAHAVWLYLRFNLSLREVAGEKFWLWRAVDQNGTVLEEILQKRRDKGAAKAEVASGLDHWSHKGLNIQAENSHLPFRKRERTMQGHRSPGMDLIVGLNACVTDEPSGTG